MEALRAAREEMVRGESVVLATVIRTRGSTPREPGAHMAVRRDGTIAGTVGGGEGEADVIAASGEVLQEGRSRVVSLQMWAEGKGLGEGMVCGGSMEVLAELLLPDRDLPWMEEILRKTGEGEPTILVRKLDRKRGECRVLHVAGEDETPPALSALPSSFTEENQRILITPSEDQEDTASLLLERILPREVLLLFGAGHVGVTLCEIASILEFDVHVLDTRRELATPERFPRAQKLISSPWEEALAGIPQGERFYSVLVTHGYTEDVQVLEKLAGRKYAYIGVIGSRRRAATVRRLLKERGVRETDLPRLYSPIGIDIGALTPAEIAVSIAAEMVAVRNGRIPPPSSLSRE